MKNTDNTQGMSEVGLKEMAAIASRNGRSILLVSLAATVLAAVVLTMIAPRYRAEALILIEPGGTQVTGMESLVPGLSTEPEAIKSEIEILKSRQLAREVIYDLGLDKFEEYGATLAEAKQKPLGQIGDKSQSPDRSDSPVSKRDRVPAGADAASAPGDKLTAPQGLKERKSLTMDNALRSKIVGSRDGGGFGVTAETRSAIAEVSVEVVEKFLENLSVEVRPQTRVVEIGFYSQKPELAAVIANALANRYLLNQEREKASAISEAAAWLDEQVEALRRAVNQSETAVEQYRRDAGLVDGRATTLVNEEISALNVELGKTRAELARLSARRQEVRRSTSSSGDLATLSEVLGSTLIQQLRSQQAELEGQIAEAATDLGELHPRLIRLRAEAREVEAKIEQEINRIVAGLNQEVSIARARERTLVAQLDAAKDRVASMNEAEIQLRALEREASSNRQQLETALAQLVETSVQRDAQRQRPDARLISKADVPADPAYPMKKTILALIFLTSMFMGFLVVLTREMLDRTFRGGEQVEQLTGLISLGIIPKISKLKASENPADLIVSSPRSAFSQSLRTLTVSLELTSKKPAKTILVSSAQAGESKTSMVASLARTYALKESRVIMLDCDLRRPGIHTQLETSVQPGLSDVLTGSCSLSEVIRKDLKTDARFISAGSTFDDPSRLIQSGSFRELLRQLASEFDVVLIDSAPVLAFADALVLAHMVDYVLFLISWGETTQRTAQGAIRKLQSAGTKDMGALLTKVNLKRFSNYGFGESGSYTGRLAEYYSE